MAELELIDRKALGIGKAKREIFDVPEYADGWNSAIEVIDNAPTIEAKPVVHAHWNEHREFYEDEGFEGYYYSCSNCGGTLYGDLENFNFCQQCGAQMDELVSKTDELESSEKPNSQSGAENE